MPSIAARPTPPVAHWITRIAILCTSLDHRV
jgi:hypothetical protein